MATNELAPYRYLAAAYLVASGMALVFGIHVANAIGPDILVAFFLVLGPPGALCYIAIDPAAMLLPALTVYVLATALLAVCLFVARRKSRTIRICVYCVAGLIWIGTGYVVLVGQLYG